MTKRGRLLAGALHVHTNHSHDGKLTMQQVVEFFQKQNYSFVVVTEHSQDLDEDAIRTLEAEAKNLSTERFVVIPGIEYSCDGWIHILGLGVTSLCDTKAPALVIDHIHARNGIAVLAHPSLRDYPLLRSWVQKLDGCEIWNCRSDGRYFPRFRSVLKFRELAKWNPQLLAFVGLDFHDRTKFCHVATRVFVDTICRDSILAVLKQGGYVMQGTFLRTDARGRQILLSACVGSLARLVLRVARFVVRPIKGTDH